MPDVINVPQTEEEWLGCLVLPEYHAKIPAGHLLPIGGDEIWIDGNGVELTTESYKTMHGCDPAIVWAAKKRYLKEHGPGVHIESPRGGTPVKLGKY